MWGTWGLFCGLLWGLLALSPCVARAETWVVGGAYDNPPFEFLDESDTPQGFTVDLIRRIAERAGATVDIRLTPWKQSHEALLQGEVDLLLGVSPTPDRLKTYVFSEPVTLAEYAIFSRLGTPPATSFKDLDGKTVVVKDGGLMASTLSLSHPLVRLVRTYSLEHALRLMMSGDVEYLICPAAGGQYYAALHGYDRIRMIGPPVLLVPFAYAGLKGQSEALVERLNTHLEALKSSGEYQTLSTRWLSPAAMPAPTARHIWRRILYVVVPLAAGLCLCLLWSRLLVRKVNQRTQELSEEVRLHQQARAELETRQQMLIQADRLASLGTMSTGIAHEINTPNGFILLNLPLLERMFKETRPYLDRELAENGDFRFVGRPYSLMREEVPQLFADLREGAERIRNIVRDLKDYARSDVGDPKEPVDLNALTADTLRVLGSTIKRHGRCTTSFAPDLPRVAGVPRRLRQVITNLVLNACEALSDRSRTIAVNTRALTDTGQVELAVTDEGCGIEPEQLFRITSPFYTTKREKGGTGLGLSVAMSIVQEHGGELHFASTPGQGTEVRLCLPALCPSVQADACVVPDPRPDLYPELCQEQSPEQHPEHHLEHFNFENVEMLGGE